MKHVVTNAEGFPTAFYAREIHGNAIPKAAVEITDEQWQELIDNAGYRRFVDGKVIVFTPPAPIPAVDDYRRAIQSLIDETARARGYDNGVSCASYVADPQPTWAAEATAFVGWRSSVWGYVNGELERVQSGERGQPSIADFLAELPTIEWPSAEGGA